MKRNSFPRLHDQPFRGKMRQIRLTVRMQTMRKTRTYAFRWLALAFWGMLALSICSCATPVVKPVETSDFRAHLQFLNPGSTSREEVLLKLGEPSGQYEGERIFTYLLAIGQGKLRVVPRQMALSSNDPRVYALSPAVCSLVIVFRTDGILEKFSLIGSRDELK